MQVSILPLCKAGYGHALQGCGRARSLTTLCVLFALLISIPSWPVVAVSCVSSSSHQRDKMSHQPLADFFAYALTGT